MEQAYRNNLKPIDIKRPCSDGMKVDLGDTRIICRFKNIRELPPYSLLCFRSGVHIHWPLLEIVKRAYIIHTRRMIFMSVGKNNSIQLAHLLAQHLITEIGAAVYYNSSLWRFYIDRYP